MKYRLVATQNTLKKQQVCDVLFERNKTFLCLPSNENVKVASIGK